ncbi:MAG: hypothetical protein M3299_11655 [Thermoproteota archaeon]|nr:hypothetical protein [Thermoproteota archaeon]
MKGTIISKQDEFGVAGITILFQSSTSQFNFGISPPPPFSCNFSRLYNMTYDGQLPFIPRLKRFRRETR